MLTDLADACRRSGLAVVEEPGWQGRGHGQMTAVTAIVCHHTAGPRSGELPSLRVVRDGRADLPGPLAQLMLSRSGVVHVIAAGLCWHAGNTWTRAQSNGYAIGIEAEATGVDPWPPAQYAAYARLCRALADHYRVPYGAIQGHKEVCKPAGRKSDPNFDMAAFRALVARIGQPSTAPAPTPSEEDDMNAEQARQLAEIHRESTQRLKRRIDGSTYTDTVMGYAMNADSFGFRAAEALARIEKGQADIVARLDKLEQGGTA